MIQKIFSVGPENWLRGLSPSRYYNGGAALYEAKGIDLMMTPGRLAAGGISSTVYDHTNNPPLGGDIRCFAYKPGYAQFYGYADDGKIYSLPYAGSETVACTTYGHGQALEFYAGGLAFAQDTRVGDYDWTTWDSEGICVGGTLDKSNYHPMKVGADKNLYIGNVNKIAKWDGATFTANKLTFDSYYTITALENDGFYLVIGAEGWIGGTPLGNKNIVTIFFWDMVSNQASRLYNLPDANGLMDLKYKDGYVYAFCGNILYKCSFDTAPQKALYRSGMEFGHIAQYGSLGGIMNDVLYWPESNDGTINAYGAPQHDLRPILYSPGKVGIEGATSEVTAIMTYQPFNVVYVATDDHALHRFYVTTGGTGAIGVTATSPLIDLGRYWKLHYLKVVTEPLASGDVLTMSLKQNPSGTELLSQTTFSYAESGAKTSKLLHVNGSIVNQVQFQATFTAGSVKIANIELYGEPTQEYYAEC